MCSERLSKAIDHERLISFSFTGSHPVVGRVDGMSFRIRKRICYRNSFQTFLTGSMQSHGAGTLILGKFGMHRFVRTFMSIWFGGVAVLGSILFMVALFTIFSGSSSHRSLDWLGVVVPLLLFAGGIVIVRVGEYFARDEARFLTNFLREALQANGNPREADVANPAAGST